MNQHTPVESEVERIFNTYDVRYFDGTTIGASDAFNKDLNTLATQAYERGKAEERLKIVGWVAEKEIDAEEEANDPTNDFIAHDAYESKSEAFYYGFNQAVKEIVEYLSPNTK